MSSRLPLGAPGIYDAPKTRTAALSATRMDVCAFVGVAPRGPARVPGWSPTHALAALDPAEPRRRSVPVVVESWADYRRRFGGFEGPGLLPYAVASFFDQGGRRAVVVRIVRRAGDPLADVARGFLAGLTVDAVPPAIVAKNPGSWGNACTVRVRLTTRELRRSVRSGLEGADLDAVASSFPPGTLLAIGPDDQATFVPAEELASAHLAVSNRVAIVELTVSIDDHAGHTEQFVGLGLRASHPRFAARVLAEESELVSPDFAWCFRDLDPAMPLSRDGDRVALAGGADDYDVVDFDDFLADGGDPDDEPTEGVRAIGAARGVAMLVVPDLYAPRPLPPAEPHLPVDPAAFGPCGPTPSVAPMPVSALPRLALDPDADLDRIVDLQGEVVAIAEENPGCVALLDVPPRLSARQIERWRARFDSTFAAGYHPWLRVDSKDDERGLLEVNPAAIAAGIIARREIAVGVPFGPANEVARNVVDVLERVDADRHDRLHAEGINVYVPDRDGVRLTGARTLTVSDPSYRQLSVRRLISLLARTLEDQMQWLAFEPNGPALRGSIESSVENLLRRLYRANAFVGKSEDEAFFVRCDDSVNPRASVLAGRLVCEVGVAPAEPMEFIVLRLQRTSDGTVAVEG